MGPVQSNSLNTPKYEPHFKHYKTEKHYPMYFDHIKENRLNIGEEF